MVHTLDYEDLIIPINATQQLRFTIDNPVEKWIIQGVHGILWSAYGEYVRSLGAGVYDSKLQWYFPEIKHEMPRKFGWQSRSKPIINKGRLLLPLYSDAYQASIIAYTDNDGRDWSFSNPIIGGANLQPALTVRENGDIYAYMRDNGVHPKRVLLSVSKDNGLSWSVPQDLSIPNPGSALDVANLSNGRFAMIYNDTIKGRHALALSTSRDGVSWQDKIYIQYVPNRSFAYPSMIVDKAGNIHMSYSGGTGATGEIEYYTIPNKY